MTRLPSAALAAFLLCMLAPTTLAQNETTTLPPSAPLENADFETGDAGNPPDGWQARPGAGGKIELDHTLAFKGEQCVRFTVTDPGSGERLFANLMQSIDAKPYQGKRVRFRAAVQVKDLPADTRVQLWLRVDEPKAANGKIAASAFDNMGDRPIKNTTWAHHDIVLDVAPDAARIACGAFVIGAGTAWLDDVSLTLVGDDVPTTPRQSGSPTKPATTPARNQPQTSARPAPPPLSDQLQNGDFEGDLVGAAPAHWRFTSNSGATAQVDDKDPNEGAHSLHVDAVNGKGARNPNTSVSQTFSAKEWRGKRVKYTAAVRVSEVGKQSSVTLSMRVGMPRADDGSFRRGPSDGMWGRSITKQAWDRYEIILDVPDDAENIHVAMMIRGQAMAWFDAATITEAAAGEEQTGRDPRVMRALDEAADAPQQPFWTWWLTLPAIATGLFLFAMWPLRRIRSKDENAALTPAAPSRLRWFAFDFTLVYWLLYCLPRPVSDVLSGIGGDINRTESDIAAWFFESSSWLRSTFTAGRTWVVETTANMLFDIPRDQLVPPNGSGDTTYSYIANFSMFLLAMLAATGLAFWRRKPGSYAASIDVTRSFLRYVLAFYMLGYGLAKTGMASNQFPMVGEWQLDKSWGDSSPMNVLWSFMGASRPYTIFGGLCEVIAGLLLIWRRTATLGGLVGLGVMTNVMLLNYCYDVPVKLLSTHLVIMSIMICTPDIVRLTQAFVLQRTTLAPVLPSVWTGTWQRWTRLALKIVIIGCCFASPIYDNLKKTQDYYEHEAEMDEKFGPEKKPDARLVKRGYRWINEVPFNR